ncbi:MAG: VWA domain-containing protein [Bacteroidia bacterium]|nr:VWA domain-containing protein [Bacteroidia bacterium]
MKSFILLILFIFVAISMVLSQQYNQEKPLTNILFVFDASQSMLQEWQTDKKINVARNMLSRMIDSLDKIDNVRMALRVYGHQKPVPPQDCDDTKLEVPFSENSSQKIIQKLRYISPRGTTPIARTLEICAGDFPKCENCRNILILITDGIEECGGDPCAVAKELRKKGIILRPFVIGVGLDIEFRKTFECVGQFFNAKSEEEFITALNVIISIALNSTSVQVNLLDSYGKPTETDVNMTFYDITSGKMVYNYMHTINSRGVPDTLQLDPLITYKMIAHTLPPVNIDTIQITPGKHTIVAADAPQGYLIIKDGSSMNFSVTPLIVRQKGKTETLNVQYVNETVKYITGLYDLEILILPRIYLNALEVKQSHTTTVQIPLCGSLNIQKATLGCGSIYLEEKNDLRWVYELDPSKSRESLSLQPGNYRLIYRPKFADQSVYTFQKSFKITSGGAETIKLN